MIPARNGHLVSARLLLHPSTHARERLRTKTVASIQRGTWFNMSAVECDCIVDPRKMVAPYVAVS
jgi:hypothetical protein